MKLKKVALLPIKANSDRIKRKNFRYIAGRPLFQWILDTLLSIEDIDLVVINTDAGEELYESGLQQDDRILIRPRANSLCGDTVNINLILADDINNVDSDIYVMTHTTNPLICKDTIIEGFELIAGQDLYDSLFSVNEIHSRFYDRETRAINHDPQNLIRTQDLEPWYEENSCLYYFTKESFKSSNARIGSNPMMMKTPPIESIDIDEQYQWDIVEALLMKRRADN